MYKLIRNDGRVNYGCIDELIDFNHQNFSLKNIMGGKRAFIGRKLSSSVFNFIGVSAPGAFAGIGIVHLGYLANIFAFYYEKDKGVIFNFSRIVFPSSLEFPLNPDSYDVTYNKRGLNLSISKSHKKGFVSIDCDIKDVFSLHVHAPYGFNKKPLRVLNPSCGDPTRFTFTEKCPLIKPDSLFLKVFGEKKHIPVKQADIVYDWSGGYLNRFTHWFWSAFSGESGGVKVGANFAAMVNETFYPENAYWINGKRIRTSQVIFDFDMYNPGTGDWKIFTEDGRVNLTFRPMGERKNKVDLLFIQLLFRQFAGEYSGTLTDALGKKIKIKNITGIAEVHLSKW
jgi:hypothetical protein